MAGGMTSPTRPNLVGLAAGVLSAGLGLAVVVGWHTHSVRLLQLHPRFVAMVYNTALAFLLCGLAAAALALGRGRLAVPLGAAAALLGLLNLAEHLFDIDLGIDQFLVEHYVTVGTPSPGRMAPNTALSFALVGTALALMGRRAPSAGWRPLVVGLVGSVTVALGAVGSFGYLAGLRTYGWGRFLPMAPHTAGGLAVLGTGVMALAWREGRAGPGGGPSWLPIPAGVAGVTAALCLWQALLAQGQAEREALEQAVAAQPPEVRQALADRLLGGGRSALPEIALVVGLLTAGLLAIAVHFAQAARRRLGALRAAVAQLSASAADILAGTSRQAAGSREQAAALSRAAATISQVAQAAAEAARQARGVSESVSRTAEVGRAGRRAVEESLDALRGVQEQVGGAARAAEALAGQAQAVGAIIATVQDIAEQTHVLALNAAMEAARAGEHGRGFAVVAGEVKGLAAQSRQGTAQVRKILGDIQRGTQAAVAAGEAVAKATAQAAAVAGRAGEAIQALARTLDAAGGAAGEIAASQGRQADAIALINRAMGDIEQAARQGAEAIRQVEQAAQGLSTLSNRLANGG
jgi:methyl-accepting chemotaxis protein